MKTKPTEPVSAKITAPGLAQVIPIPLYRDTGTPLPEFYKSLRKLIPERKTKLEAGLPLDRSLNRYVKRVADILISVPVILLVLSWLLPVLALLIKLDSKGPVFFLQKRNGRQGRLFTCIKLRSMYPNYEADLIPAAKNDRRITRIGKFLRNHYLDELPQFFNVFIGQMSVIGPRPHMCSDNELFAAQVEHYHLRHKVKPGITGLAQALGYLGAASDINRLRCRVQLDIIYIRHWSPLLDTKIIVRTLAAVLRGTIK